MIWWFAVPILNLFRPYQAVKAVWECSAPEHGGAAAARDDVLWPWWAAWLVWIVLQQGTAALAPFELSTVNRDLTIAVTSSAAAVSAALALRMVRALAARQGRRAAELWA